MPLYEASGQDPSSDDGYWVMIFEAANRRQAQKKVRDHLREHSRPDLIKGFDLERIKHPIDTIYYSNVQS